MLVRIMNKNQILLVIFGLVLNATSFSQPLEYFNDPKSLDLFPFDSLQMDLFNKLGIIKVYEVKEKTTYIINENGFVSKSINRWGNGFEYHYDKNKRLIAKVHFGDSTILELDSLKYENNKLTEYTYLKKHFMESEDSYFHKEKTSKFLYRNNRLTLIQHLNGVDSLYYYSDRYALTKMEYWKNYNNTGYKLCQERFFNKTNVRYMVGISRYPKPYDNELTTYYYDYRKKLIQKQIVFNSSIYLSESYAYYENGLIKEIKSENSVEKFVYEYE